MTEQRSGPYIWVTWLSRLLVGDRSCEWASWFKAHHKNYDRVPSDFDMVTWQMNHTELLNEVRARLHADGRTVLTENQNHFSLRGSSGTVIGGKPDLVVLDSNGDGTVYDIKTGQPRASDTAQVMIYMYALPHMPKHRGATFDGLVVYANGDEVRVPATAINETFKTRLYELIRRVSSPEPAERVPSGLECGMCDLTPNDCPDRIDEDTREKVADGAGF